MIIIISPELTKPTEIAILHKLFKAGLTHYHLRKPEASLEQHKAYLQQINSQYHACVMVHNFREELSKEFAIKGVHLEEATWRSLGDSLSTYVRDFKERGFSVSSSYHEPEDLERQPVLFDYTILSPVFSAISKSGMAGRGFNVQGIDKKIVGMGGINVETTPEAINLGFQGVGALGGVWNTEDAVSAFKEMKSAFAKAIKVQ